MNRTGHISLFIFWLFFGSTAVHAELADTIEKIKPSVVAVGTYKKTQSPPFIFRGTGFAIGDGNLVATNAHVLPGVLDPEGREGLTVLLPGPGEPWTALDHPARSWVYLATVAAVAASGDYPDTVFSPTTLALLDACVRMNGRSW